MRGASVALLVCLLGGGCKGPRRDLVSPPAIRVDRSTQAAVADAPVLRLREEDEDGGVWEVGVRAGVVDINSRLHVAVDKDALRGRLREEYGLESFSQEDLDLLWTLQRGAEDGLRCLTRLRDAMTRFTALTGAPTGEDVRLLQEGIASAATAGAGVLYQALAPGGELEHSALASRLESRLESEIALRAARNSALSIEETYFLCFDECAREAERLRDALDAQLTEQAIFVQLGAWTLSGGRPTPVHLQGFDAYPEGPYYRVERWNVAPSEHQVRLIEELDQLARSIEGGELESGEFLRSFARSTASGLLEVTNLCVEEIRLDLLAIAGEGERIARAFHERVLRLQVSMRQYGLLIVTKTAKYLDEDYLAGMSLSELLRTLQSDYDEIRRATEDLVDEIRLLGDPDSILQPGSDDPDLEQRVNELLASIQECRVKLEGQVRALAANLAGMFGIQLSAERINAAALEFGEKVLRHDIRTLPEETVLDLKFTGARAENDSVLFKLGTGRVDPATGQAKEAVRQLQAVYVDLFQVLVHFDTSANLIFADPNGTANLSSRWQFAPAYSVLLKWGSRDRPLYNRLIDAGVGINIAILDFDGDDNPELGVGGVVAILRDILQAGYGYNISEDLWYGFFGIGLPLSAIQNALN